MDDSQHTIEVVCSATALDALLPLLQEIQHMGSIGSSRGIKIEDWDGRTNFGFDGDGSDDIFEIRVDGKKKEASVSQMARRIVERWVFR
jgi:hypothetical protein